MEKRMKQNLLVVIMGVGLFAALMNLPVVLRFVAKVIGIILPAIVGGILALFINVPMTGIEKRLCRVLGKRKKKPSDKFYRGASFILTFICNALVLTLVFTLLIPELVSTVNGLYLLIEARLPEWIAWLESLDPEAEWLEEMLESFNLEKIMQSIGSGANLFFESVVSTVSSAASVVLTAVWVDYQYLSDIGERMGMQTCQKAVIYLPETHMGRKYPSFQPDIQQVFCIFPVRAVYGSCYSWNIDIFGIYVF